MNISKKTVNNYTTTIEKLRPIAERKSASKSWLAGKLGKIVGNESVRTFERQARLFSLLDEVQKLAEHQLEELGDTGTVLITPRVRESLPTVNVDKTPEGKREIGYQVGPSHQTEPQRLVFTTKDDEGYSTSLHHYQDGVVVESSIAFHDLTASQQDTLLIAIETFNDKFMHNPGNFDVSVQPLTPQF